MNFKEITYNLWNIFKNIRGGKILIWIVPIIIGLMIAWYFYKRSASKKDVQNLKGDIEELKEIDSNAEKNIVESMQTGFEKTQEGNKVYYALYLENLINNQFNRFFESRNLDKYLLIKELEGHKAETIIMIKQKEGDENKLLRERIKLLGFKRISYGDWVLPPKKLRDKHLLKKKGGVKEWVENNLLKQIDPKNFVNSAFLVDLSNIYDEEEGKARKARKIIGGVLKPADIISKEKLLGEIYKQDKLSLRDIIQIPFIDTLIEQEHPEISEEKIKPINTQLVEKIKIKLGLSTLKTSDISRLKKDDLIKILDQFNLNNTEELSTQILQNAEILNSYLNKNEGVQKC